jgi:hypothetical protein
MAIPKVELTKKWWITSRPKDVKGVELEKALAAVEQADDGHLAAALAAVSGAIAKAAKELDKKEDKDLLKALDSLDALADAAKKKAEAEAKAAAQAKTKEDAKAKEEEPESEDEEDDEHTPEDKFFEPAFQLTTLRRGLRAPIIFAFAMGAKPEQSLLAVHVRGNPKNLLRIAKTRSGALKGCFGHAQAAEDDPKTLTLSLDCPLIGGLARSVRKYFQLNKITVFRKIRVVVDGKEAESDTGEEAPPEVQAQAAAPAAAAAPPGAKAAPRPAAAPPPEEPTVPLTEKQLEEADDRRQEFKKARAAWVAVKNKAEMDLEKVKDGARTLYSADAGQFPKIVQGCKDIDSILDNLDDALRDTLDRYASTPLKQQAKLHELAANAKEILDGYRDYVENNAVMKAIDQKEFADVTIHAPIMKALNDLRKTLA